MSIPVFDPAAPSSPGFEKAAAKALGLDYQLEKVTDINRILEFGVMVTPALVVDGRVKVVGKVPSPDDIQKLLA